MMSAPRKHRQLTEKKLLIGTQNLGKIKEFESLLAPFPIQIISLQDQGIIDPQETGDTFLENALLKALYYSNAFQIPALADDSGFCIKALNQKPGVQSKRFIQEQGGEAKTFDYLKGVMKNQDPSVCLHCALALVWPDGHSETFEGIWEGALVFPARRGKEQNSGFGIDPIFQPHGHTKTSSEDLDYKKKYSHRTQALNKLLAGCF